MTAKPIVYPAELPDPPTARQLLADDILEITRGRPSIRLRDTYAPGVWNDMVGSWQSEHTDPGYEAEYQELLELPQQELEVRRTNAMFVEDFSYDRVLHPANIGEYLEFTDRTWLSLDELAPLLLGFSYYPRVIRDCRFWRFRWPDAGQVVRVYDDLCGAGFGTDRPLRAQVIAWAAANGHHEFLAKMGWPSDGLPQRVSQGAWGSAPNLTANTGRSPKETDANPEPLQRAFDTAEFISVTIQRVTERQMTPDNVLELCREFKKKLNTDIPDLLEPRLAPIRPARLSKFILLLSGTIPGVDRAILASDGSAGGEASPYLAKLLGLRPQALGKLTGSAVDQLRLIVQRVHTKAMTPENEAELGNAFIKQLDDEFLGPEKFRLPQLGARALNDLFAHFKR